MNIARYLEDIPKLHSWDDGATWNTSGMDAPYLRRLFDFVKGHQCQRVIETGAGNSTLTFLLAGAERVVSVAPDAGLFQRIVDFCDQNDIPHEALEEHVVGSQWLLPQLATTAPADFDFALIDGAHGWPYVFIDLFYVQALVRPGGYIMLDSKEIYSVGEAIRWLEGQTSYAVALDLGRSVIFRKSGTDIEFPEWNGQPYIIRRTDAAEADAISTDAALQTVHLRADDGTMLSPLAQVLTVEPAAARRTLITINGAASPEDDIDAAARSARIVVPLVMKLVRDVRSVVHVGCGAGAWLAQFKEQDVPRVLGLDRSAPTGGLEIDPDEYREVSLEDDIRLGERLDLCACIETAATVSESTAPTLVRSLCGMSDIVLFSAAIPGQGGARHVNERWPTYWADLFASAGYEPVDILRGRIWNDARVEWPYRQNLLFFVNQAGLPRLSVPARLNGHTPAAAIRSTPLDVVHPACFEVYRQPFEQSVVTSAPARSPVSGAVAGVPRQGVARYATAAYWRNRMAKLRRSLKKRL